MLTLAENLTHTGSALTSPATPVLTRRLGGKYASGMPITIQIERTAVPAANSKVEVFSAPLPHPSDTTNQQRFDGDGTTTVFDATLDYAAISNHNWIVLVGPNLDQLTLREVLASGAAGTQVNLTNNSGKVRLTFATAPAKGLEIRLCKVTSTTLYSGTDRTKVLGSLNGTAILSNDLLWLRHDDTAQASPTTADLTTAVVRSL